MSDLLPSMLSARATVEVPFHDVDSMNVCWHGNYLKYFEFGRAALLRSIDYDYACMQASGFVWPIVDCRLKFVRPARYGQRLVVEASLIEHENRLKIDYRVMDEASCEVLVKGYTVQVAVEASSGQTQYVSPSIVFEKIAAARSASR